jgi:hypothetical protein
LSSDSVHKLDPREVCKAPKGEVFRPETCP